MIFRYDDTAGFFHRDRTEGNVGPAFVRNAISFVLAAWVGEIERE